MNRLVFVVGVVALSVACGRERATSPVAPTSIATLENVETTTSFPHAPTFGVAPSENRSTADTSAPFHILHPVSFAMSPGVITFPPRNEPNAFFTALQALYRDTLRRQQNSPTYVDPEGQNVWLTEYFRFYLNGCSHEDSVSRTLAQITTGATQPTCGAERLAFPPRDLPNAFQGQLDATYRDVLRRPLLFSYVDSEGANVWLAQYLRFRVASNCDHSTAQNKVFAEIRGGGVQPDCGPPFSRSGMGNTVFDLPSGITRIRIIGVFTGRSSNFIVRIGGRLVVNELLGTTWGPTRYEGVHLISGTVVEITNSSSVSWTFEEVRQ